MLVKGAPDDYTMSFGDHLEELRRRIVYALIGLVVAAVVMLIFGTDIVAWLLEPLNRVQRQEGLVPQAVGLAVTTAFAVYLKVSLVSGLVVSSPWIAVQLWIFVAEGLYASERKVVAVLAPFSTVMMALGVMFSYYIMLPVCLTFLISFSTQYPQPGGREGSVSDQLSNAVRYFTSGEPSRNVPEPGELKGDEPGNGEAVGVDSPFKVPVLDRDPLEPEPGQMWVNRATGDFRVVFNGRVHTLSLAATTLMTPMIEIGSYINFVLLTTLGVCIGFQIPVVLLIACGSGVVNPSLFKRYRAHIVLGMFVIAAVLTPQDPISMCVLAVPLWVLFEFGLIIGRIAHRRRRSSAAAEPAEPDGP